MRGGPVSRRPLRRRVLDARDRARDAAKTVLASVVALAGLGVIFRPRRRRKPGPEQWFAARRRDREHLDSPTNEEGTQK